MLVILGGVAFGVRVPDRMLFATTRYRLGEYRLFATVNSLFKRSSIEIARRQILQILRLYTPPETVKDEGTYRTIVIYRMPNAGRGELASEGITEQEAERIGPMIAEWANVPMRRDFAAGYEEALLDENAPDHETIDDDK